AVGDESGLVGGAVDGWADPLGVRLHTVDPLAPVLALSGPETDPGEPPRAVPLLGTGDASAAATSGTGPGPAAPIAPRPLTRLEAAAGQETPRPASTTSRRFGDPRVDPPSAGDSGRSAGAGGRSAHPSPLGPTIGRMLASQAVRATLPQTEPSQPVRPAAEEAPPSAGRHDAPRRPPPPHARPLAGQGPSPASPPVAAPQLPPCDVARPGRASGMLPVPVVPGAALAAATARALAAAYGLRDPADDPSSDDDEPDGPADAGRGPQDPAHVAGRPGRAAGRLPVGRALGADAARAPTACHAAPEHHDSRGDDADGADTSATPCPDPASVLPRPGRVGGMLADSGVPGAASSFPSAAPSSPAAAAAASQVAAAAAAHAAPPADRAAPEHRGRAAPSQDHDTPARALTEPSSSDVISSGDSSTRSTKARSSGDDGDDGARHDRHNAAAAVPMDVDQDARWPAAGTQPLSPPPVLCIGGKRRPAAAAAPLVTAVAAAPATSPVSRAAVEPRARAEPPQEQAPPASARVGPMSGDVVSSDGSSRTTDASGDGDDGAGSSDAAGDVGVVAMDVDQGARRQQPPWQRVGGKRRRLNDVDDEDTRELAELLLEEEDEAGDHAPAPRLSAASARPASVLSVYVHNAQRFQCTLCTYTAASFASLKRHRDSRHRRTAFLDRFSAGSPPELAADDETKDGEEDQSFTEPVAAARSEDGEDANGEWLLRFDGACRANPGPGGAGAALFKPSGPVVWTCSHYMPSSSETNNTAEYTALLLGMRAAADHGATRVHVEGDSTLVIQQVRGIFATRSTRLRGLRKSVKAEMARMEHVTLHHIDRQANGHADRLANAALDRRKTKLECGLHPDGEGCSSTAATTVVPSVVPDRPPSSTAAAPTPSAEPDETEQGDIDDGEVYAAMCIGPDSIPERRPRLRLRQLSETEEEEAGAIVERLAATLAGKITDASDWATAEGCITALPYTLYDKLQPFAQHRHQPRPQHRQQPQRDPPLGTHDGDHGQPSTSRSRRRRRRRRAKDRLRRRPPRITRHHREHRLDEALDDLRAVEHASPHDRPAVARARRRVGRVNSAIAQQQLRHKFDKDEKACVDGILAAARASRGLATPSASASRHPPPVPSTAADDGSCPIPSDELHAFFTAVNTPAGTFEPMAPVGAPFRSAVAHLPAATSQPELLSDAPTTDDIEDQLQRARGSSSPGLDGVGYDIYKAFAAQLLPALHAAFACCWRHKQVPQSWKVGVVRLLFKKGERTEPANWRPICLQQAIYKLYAGVLARRLTRWLDANGRHADTQKGFRAMNGCGEHNFLAATLVDQARRKRRELHVVWYDFANAFGSVPHDLLWEALERQGVPSPFIACCRGLYADAAFTVGNAADGTTAPIALRVGVFQGCPLSPHLFTAAIAPLLHALKRLPDTGVQLSRVDCPGASAYADDLKIFSGTEGGTKRQHALVADFLRWTGMRANPAKCCTMSVQRDTRGVLKACNLGLQLDGAPIPALTMSASYAYLGIGDGFDHVRRRIELAPKLQELKHDATALLQSGLAPWQVVKAVKVYLYPRVEYALRHLRPFHQQLEGFDRHLVRGLRHLLRLPANATTAFFYAPVSRGGLGLLPLTELHAALQVAHGWQMLNSKDPAIRRIARVQLRQIADARHRIDAQAWQDREEELAQLLLNSQLGASTGAPPKRRNGDIGSLWVDVQRHLRHLSLKLETAPACAETGTAAAMLQLRVPHHDKWLDHKTVLRHVKLHYKNKHWARWAAMKDQGKTARAHGGAGSGFLTRPQGMWEADYRFAVAARLNQLDTHSVLKRRRLRQHDRCRQPGCTRGETLAHVLNHCAGTMDAVRGRHDDALKHIERALHASSPGGQDRVELP
uniref:RNase H type-1 domain-containing protein n=1 Tax=Phytophthora ramorum TaxID=164328 RepID=H3H7T4_PHYRM